MMVTQIASQVLCRRQHGWYTFGFSRLLGLTFFILQNVSNRHISQPRCVDSTISSSPGFGALTEPLIPNSHVDLGPKLSEAGDEESEVGEKIEVSMIAELTGFLATEMESQLRQGSQREVMTIWLGVGLEGEADK